MSFADDHASPQAPFSGDETGKIFDTPDLVLQSPTTSERVVDTQSGFVVVVKQLEKRLALSVKRQLGTPPTSSILLTPDESLKLSRILDCSNSYQPKALESEVETVSDYLQAWNRRFENRPTAEQIAYLEKAAEATELPNEPSVLSTEKPQALFNWLDASFREDKQKVLLISLAIAGMFMFGISLINNWNWHEKQKPAIISTTATQSNSNNKEQVDKFVRNYVSNLLDFSAETYRFSQIQAMSQMTPALMAEYWQQTNFPIPQQQLSKGSTRDILIITNVLQQTSTDGKSKIVDVYAQLKGSDGKISSPTHLQLTLATEKDNQIQVLAQKILLFQTANKSSYNKLTGNRQQHS